MEKSKPIKLCNFKPFLHKAVTFLFFHTEEQPDSRLLHIFLSHMNTRLVLHLSLLNVLQPAEEKEHFFSFDCKKGFLNVISVSDFDMSQCEGCDRMASGILGYVS